MPNTGGADGIPMGQLQVGTGVKVGDLNSLVSAVNRRLSKLAAKAYSSSASMLEETNQIGYGGKTYSADAKGEIKGKLNGADGTNQLSLVRGNLTNGTVRLTYRAGTKDNEFIDEPIKGGNVSVERGLVACYKNGRMVKTVADTVIFSFKP